MEALEVSAKYSLLPLMMFYQFCYARAVIGRLQDIGAGRGWAAFILIPVLHIIMPVVLLFIPRGAPRQDAAMV